MTSPRSDDLGKQNSPRSDDLGKQNSPRSDDPTISSVSMTSDDVKREIIWRAKLSAELYGNCVVSQSDGEADPEKANFEIYSLRLVKPDSHYRIFWVKSAENLRIRLTVPSMGHIGSFSIVDTHVGRETWHHTDHNNELLTELQRLMVLDDLAGI